MKIGIIGAGNIAKAHLAAAKNIGDIDIVGVYDLDYKRAQCFDKTITAHLSVDDLMDKIDSVIIATPNNTHANYTKLAIEKNKHVLCEKPMAISVAEAECMANMASNSRLCCRIGLNYRFLDIFQTLKQLIKNNELGTILSIDMEFKRSSALTRKTHTWRDGAESMATSGALGDLGIHLIDMLYYLFSTEINIDSCAVKIATYVPEKENSAVHVDDYAIVNGMLLNGIYFRLLTSKVALTSESGFFMKIIGTEKEFFYTSAMKDTYSIKTAIHWDVQKLTSSSKFLEDPPAEIYGWSQSFVAQLASWVQCINNDSITDNATFLDGLKEQKTLSAFLSKKTFN